MAFTFRLQAVLDHRTYLEDLAKMELGKRQRARQECLDQIAWLQEEMGRTRDQIAGGDGGGVPADKFIRMNEYATILRLQSMRETARLPKLEAHVAAARAKLILATQDRKALEVLRDKHQAQYKREQLMAEQRLLDEVAVGGFVRRNLK